MTPITDVRLKIKILDLKRFVYPNGQSFFNIKMKNEKQISAVARFFLQMQKASIRVE